uniref:CCAAT enhancer binding protein zeta n=1 Tax=Oryzias latipes TaxID=8090 RepID=A0A3P9IFE8_ORYLA
MAAKIKHRKRPKTAKKGAVWSKESEEEPEMNGNEEDVDPAAGDTEETKEADGEELSLDEVLRLGGTKADFVLLAGLDDSNELVDGGKKGAIDDLEEGELEKFIAELGIRSYAGQQSIPDKPEANSPADEVKESKQAKVAKGKTEGETSNTHKATKEVAKKSEDAPASSGKKAKEKANVFEFLPRQILLIKPGGKWFEMAYTDEISSTPQDPIVVNKYQSLARQLFDAEISLYRTKKNLQKGANSAWMKTVVSSGVLADRMAAMTVLIQDSAVHMLEHVESLVSMVKKKGSRRMGLMAVDTLKELLLSNLLPENRKLFPFAKRPFDQIEEMASGNRDARDRRLIVWYFEHQLKHHVAEFVSALDSVSHDTVAATKAKALATAHELLCNRPEQERALLTHVVNKLGDPDYKTATKASYLLETLLHKHPNMKVVVCCEVERLMFRPNIGAKKKDIESKMLSALLAGVNRAYPYASAGDEKVKEQLDTLFKVVHLVKFNTAVQALMLLFQVMDSEQSISDRFYSTVYRKMLDPGLSSSSRQNMFLNLLYKSLKADVVLRRVKAFVKRLLQVSAEQSASFACGALFLVSEVMKAKPGLKLLLQEEGDGEEEEFKDLKEENNFSDDDGEERFLDADKQEEGVSEKAMEAKPAASWVHHQNREGRKSSERYDPLHRNPLYCGADHTTLWELQRLAQHFHPSVSLFATTILQGESIQYTGDPLQDFTLIRFLDRFVFRNPKQLKGKQNTDSALLRPKQRLPVNSLPVNCAEFLSKEESQIPVDEIFFYRFFKKKQQEKQSQDRQRDDDSESVEEVEDEEFEKILDSVEGDSYFVDVAEDDLDFAGNVKSKKGKKSAEESESDDSDMDDLDDEEVSLGSMDEKDFDLEDELDEDGGIFMDPDGGEDEEQDSHEDSTVEMEVPDTFPQTRKKKRKNTEELDFSGSLGSKNKKKSKKGAAMFASAEEFGSLLDKNVDSKFDNIGLNAMANPDKAGQKQLRWEAERDDWIHGRDAKTLRRKKMMARSNKGSRTFRNRKKK